MAYRLELPPAWTIHDVFHVGLLTPVKVTNENGPLATPPLPEVIEGEKEWEVEKVLNHQWVGRRRQLQYLLKWKGETMADISWEPASSVFAPRLVQQYHLRHPLTINTSSKKARVSSASVFPSCPPKRLISFTTTTSRDHPLLALQARLPSPLHRHHSKHLLGFHQSSPKTESCGPKQLDTSPPSKF